LINSKAEDLKSLNSNGTFEGMPMTPPERDQEDFEIDEDQIRA
jgi:hypothetical protein